MVTYAKISPEMVNPKDTPGNAEEKFVLFVISSSAGEIVMYKECDVVTDGFRLYL